jgi:hypothetical protein
MNVRVVITALALASWPCSAHRLDEYLQATTISLSRSRIRLEMRLVPGVAVAPMILKTLDSDGDRVFSDAEQDQYVKRLRRDLDVTLDGQPLSLHLTSKTFPSIADMEEGRGAIRLSFEAEIVDTRGGARELRFENRHWRPIGAYLVNVLTPEDPDIRVVAQTRNFEQSSYRLSYSLSSRNPMYTWFAAAAMLTFVRIAWWRRFVGPREAPKP